MIQNADPTAEDSADPPEMAVLEGRRFNFKKLLTGSVEFHLLNLMLVVDVQRGSARTKEDQSGRV